MALTKAFRETVYNRAQRDGAFRKALLVVTRSPEKQSYGTSSLRPSASRDWPPTFRNPARVCIVCWVQTETRTQAASLRSFKSCKSAPE
jgi:hypothetical protein